MGAFAFETRVLSCAECAAPIQGSGRTVACTYCQAVNDVAARDDDGDRDAAARCAERGEAICTASGAGRDCAAAATRAGELETLRAMMETTVDALDDALQRQILHGLMAQEAALEGDVGAAKQWLALVPADSDDLRCDTAYRVACAMIATRAGDFDEVLAAIGASSADVPIADEDDDLCTLLRANVVECRDDPTAAARLLVPTLLTPGRADAFVAAYNAHLSLGLCARSFSIAAEQAARLEARPVSPLSSHVTMFVSVLGAFGVGFVTHQALGTSENVAAIPGVITLAAAVAYSIVQHRRTRASGRVGRAVVLHSFAKNSRKDGTRDYESRLLVTLPDTDPYLHIHTQTGLSDAWHPGAEIRVRVHPTSRK